MKLYSPLRTAILLFVLPLAACRSVSTRYYTLSMPTRDTGNDHFSAMTAPDYAFSLTPVQVPAEVDTRSLVLRVSKSRLEVLDAHEWAAPLPDEIRQAVSKGLMQRLGVQDVTDLPYPSGIPIYRITVIVTGFSSVYGQSATLSARWSVLAPPGRHPAAVVCHSRDRQKVGLGYEALVEGQQRALSTLVNKIAMTLHDLSVGRVGCH